MEKGTKNKMRGSTRRLAAGLKPHQLDGRQDGQTNRNGKRESKRSAKKEEAETGHLLRDYFIMELRDLYWAEKHLLKALPKLAKKATSEDLRDAFETHLQETEIHVQRLEQVFELLDEKARAKKCEAMQGISDEADEVIKETEDDTYTRDVALIIAAQKTEHYEIATYGGLAQLGRTLGLDDVVDLLEETLEEEKNTDRLLTAIAESHVNVEATVE
jgi:ferritin-like metal-binding protein YciE